MTMPLGPSDRALSIMTEKKREEDAEQRQTEKDVNLHLPYTLVNWKPHLYYYMYILLGYGMELIRFSVCLIVCM